MQYSRSFNVKMTAVNMFTLYEVISPWLRYYRPVFRLYRTDYLEENFTEIAAMNFASETKAYMASVYDA